MTDHPVFEKFSPYSGPVPEGCQTDYMGTRTRCEFVADAAPSPSEVQMACPPVDEEYFEWIDILESVARARDSYTMMELGAGYGRWAVRAAAAVRQRGIQNVIWWPWKRSRCISNGCSNTSAKTAWTRRNTRWCRPWSAIVPVRRFSVSECRRAAKIAPTNGMASCIPRSHDKPRNKGQEFYEGIPVIELKSGWKSIEVPAVTLASLLRDLDRVDLIDMDVQGEELKIIRSAIDDLDHKVCRLHIGTHAHHLEKGLKRALGSHGWICHFDYPCQSKTETRVWTGQLR